MRFVIDTSSLISLVRYYLPFDRDKHLFSFIESKIKSKEIIILDKVEEECRYFSNGIVVKTLAYVSEKKYQLKTTDLLPNKAFFNMLENQFLNTSRRKLLNDAEFESRKDEYLESADAKLLLIALQENKKIDGDLIVVTEETKASNDNKTFKKLPTICEMLKIECLTLPELIEKLEGISFEIT